MDSTKGHVNSTVHNIEQNINACDTKYLMAMHVNIQKEQKQLIVMLQ